MTATADKTRYFLEQSVPELKEYERKKIFTAEEIASIAKRRSDFEHKINARGSRSSDYIQYAEFETNVEALRRKRVKRMGIKSTAHNGQRRIFFVFDRGTRKFPGDIGLWMQNLQHLRQQKAFKKFTQTVTTALRLHPTNAQLWIYAAACAMEDKADMNEARSYMQRALRFIKSSPHLWIEYARLELSYMAKVHARRKVLGIATTNIQEAEGESSEDENIIRLPRLTAEDVNPQSDEGYDVDEEALLNLANTPIMSGAIPMAIFDSAITKVRNDAVFAQQFFEMVADFSDVAASTRILQHVLENMKDSFPRSWQTYACDALFPILQVLPTSAEYPAALRLALRSITEGISQCTEPISLSKWSRNWLEKLLNDDLDPALDRVIRSKLASLNK